MKISVPYYSQHRDVIQKEWKDKACGIACVAMCIDFWNAVQVNLDKLIDECVEIGGYSSHGWLHEKLVVLFHNHGVLGYREEFVSKDQRLAKIFTDRGVRKIIEELDNGRPVIVSAVKKFEEDAKYHLVLLVGYEENAEGDVEKFYYHDPDANSNDDGAYLSVDFSTFLSKWRKYAIFSYK